VKIKINNTEELEKIIEKQEIIKEEFSIPISK